VKVDEGFCDAIAVIREQIDDVANVPVGGRQLERLAIDQHHQSSTNLEIITRVDISDKSMSAIGLQGVRLPYLDTNTCALCHNLLDTDTADNTRKEHSQGIKVAYCQVFFVVGSITFQSELHKGNESLDEVEGSKVGKDDPE
jgi:hypothetical protein